MPYRFLILLFFGLLAWPGCKSEPTTVEDRFLECRDLVLNKETREESLSCFTPHSQGILRRLLAERKRSGGVLGYMTRYSKLLDYDEIVVPADIVGNVAVLVVSKRRRQATILMEYDSDEDQWTIEALELPGFWAPLDSAREDG